MRHYTSRAGDPHRHLHLQINARVFAAGPVAGPALGRRRGQHRGHERHRPRRGDVRPGVPRGARRARLRPRPGHSQRSPSWRRTPARSAPGPRRSAATSTATKPNGAPTHPGEEPGPRLRRAWDRRAWAEARPDKIVPKDGAELAERWREELHELGLHPAPAGAEIELSRDTDRPPQPRPRSSSWCSAGWVHGGRPGTQPTSAARSNGSSPTSTSSPPAPVRRELAEDLTSRTIDACVPLAATVADVPEHVRALTSQWVLDVEDDLVNRLITRADYPAYPARIGPIVAGRQLDQAQREAVAALLPGAANCSSSRARPAPGRPPPWPPPASCSRCTGTA